MPPRSYQGGIKIHPIDMIFCQVMTILKVNSNPDPKIRFFYEHEARKRNMTADGENRNIFFRNYNF